MSSKISPRTSVDSPNPLPIFPKVSVVFSLKASPSNIDMILKVRTPLLPDRVKGTRDEYTRQDEGRCHYPEYEIYSTYNVSHRLSHYHVYQ